MTEPKPYEGTVLGSGGATVKPGDPIPTPEHLSALWEAGYGPGGPLASEFADDLRRSLEAHPALKVAALLAELDGIDAWAGRKRLRRDRAHYADGLQAAVVRIRAALATEAGA